MRARTCFAAAPLLCTLVTPAWRAHAVTLGFEAPLIEVVSPETATTRKVSILLSESAGQAVISAQALVVVQVLGLGEVTVGALHGLEPGMIFAVPGATQAPIAVGSDYARGLALFAPSDENSGAPVSLVLSDGVLIAVDLLIPAHATPSDYVLTLSEPGVNTFFSDPDNNTITPDATIAILRITAAPPAGPGGSDPPEGGDAGDSDSAGGDGDPDTATSDSTTGDDSQATQGDTDTGSDESGLAPAMPGCGAAMSQALLTLTICFAAFSRRRRQTPSRPA